VSVLKLYRQLPIDLLLK